MLEYSFLKVYILICKQYWSEIVKMSSFVTLSNFMVDVKKIIPTTKSQQQKVGQLRYGRVLKVSQYRGLLCMRTRKTYGSTVKNIV